MTTEPKIVRQTWVEVYSEHISVLVRKCRPRAKFTNRIAVLRRDFYDDGTCKATLEDV